MNYHNEIKNKKTFVRKGGMLVTTKSGKQGLVYYGEPDINGKVPVHVIGEDRLKTGEKLLCDKSTLDVNGFFRNS